MRVMDGFNNHKQIILVGAFLESLELCLACELEVLGIIDNRCVGEFFGVPVLGTDEDAPRIYQEFPSAGIVLTPDKPSLRKHLALQYRNIGFGLANVVHPSAQISKSVSFEDGLFVQSGATISSSVHLSSCVRINVKATVMHDSRVAAYSTLAPAAMILGRVTIGEECYIGSNSTILPDLEIGARSVIGAGSVVTKNIPEQVIVKGIPGRFVT